MCTTSFTPPLARAPKFQIRYVHPTSLGCHQLKMVIVAKSYAWPQEPSQSAFRNIVIFVKYREVSTRTILPNFIGNCGDNGGIGKREKEEAYVKEAYVKQVLSCFKT